MTFPCGCLVGEATALSFRNSERVLLPLALVALLAFGWFWGWLGSEGHSPNGSTAPTQSYPAKSAPGTSSESARLTVSNPPEPDAEAGAPELGDGPTEITPPEDSSVPKFNSFEEKAAWIEARREDYFDANRDHIERSRAKLDQALELGNQADIHQYAGAVLKSSIASILGKEGRETLMEDGVHYSLKGLNTEHKFVHNNWIYTASYTEFPEIFELGNLTVEALKNRAEDGTPVWPGVPDHVLLGILRHSDYALGLLSR